jgi:hypothetical protein
MISIWVRLAISVSIKSRGIKGPGYEARIGSSSEPTEALAIHRENEHADCEASSPRLGGVSSGNFPTMAVEAQGFVSHVLRLESLATTRM